VYEFSDTSSIILREINTHNLSFCPIAEFYLFTNVETMATLLFPSTILFRISCHLPFQCCTLWALIGALQSVLLHTLSKQFYNIGHRVFLKHPNSLSPITNDCRGKFYSRGSIFCLKRIADIVNDICFSANGVESIHCKNPILPF